MEPSIKKKLDAFFTTFQHKSYRKGEIIIRPEERVADILYLTEGIVKQYAVSKKGEEVVINIFKPFAFFPLPGVVNTTPNLYFFETITEVNLWRAPAGKTLEFIRHDPDILYNLLSRMYNGIDGLLQRMVYLMSGNAYNRLITELIIGAKRFGVQESPDALSYGITEKELAALSGLTRETVSREMKNLKEKGLVFFTKGLITIPDIGKLEAELS